LPADGLIAKYAQASAAMLFLLSFVLFAAAPSERVDSPPTLLVHVEVDTAQPLEAAFVRDVTRTASKIWTPYIDLEFGDAPDRMWLAPVDQLHLVITDRLIAGSGDGYGLGWIEFVDGRPSRTITASITAARRLVAEASWGGVPMTTLPESIRTTFLVKALAGAIAHEVGHYLLRSKVHSRTGLMRERFAVREIMEMKKATYRLDAADERRLEKRLVEYAQAVPVPLPGTPPS
jgi:hypothetical protein